MEPDLTKVLTRTHTVRPISRHPSEKNATLNPGLQIAPPSIRYDTSTCWVLTISKHAPGDWSASNLFAFNDLADANTLFVYIFVRIETDYRPKLNQQNGDSKMVWTNGEWGLRSKNVWLCCLGFKILWNYSWLHLVRSLQVTNVSSGHQVSIYSSLPTSVSKSFTQQSADMQSGRHKTMSP